MNLRQRVIISPNMLAKCVVTALPAGILPRLWSVHGNIAFGVGLCAGILLQHFIPPRGKVADLVLILLLAIVAAFLVAKW
jgi:hypothetical protein